jgi:NAD-dependent dihydropyrimidine dehydrogenase PreA subunit
VAYVIAEPCVDVKDKRCLDECPVDAIYEGERMLYIQPDECIDCAACEMVCPVDAIYYQDDLPRQWQGYTTINADFFDELGSPGGASEVGMAANDPLAVRLLPPMGATNRSRSRKNRITEILRGGGRQGE